MGGMMQEPIEAADYGCIKSEADQLKGKTMSTETKITTGQQITPMDMLQMAVSQNADLDKLEKLMALQERWEANEAKKAYVAAMNAFRADPPVIYKDKKVKFDTSKGTTEYSHALLENAAEIIGASLTKHGLSFRWDCEQIEGQVKVTCVITHAQGHSERVTLQAGLDQSGGKNNIQALGSTVSYLERYTLFAATGMAPKGMDNDGGPALECITEQQAADLRALMEEVEADEAKFLAYFKVESIEKLPAKAYKQAVAMTEAKRKQVKK
jgi:hypothetical protein